MHFNHLRGSETLKINDFRTFTFKNIVILYSCRGQQRKEKAMYLDDNDFDLYAWVHDQDSDHPYGEEDYDYENDDEIDWEDFL